MASLSALDSVRARSRARTPAAPVSINLAGGDRYVGTDEAAMILGLAAKTLRAWRCERKGPACEKRGEGKQARVFYRVSALAAWSESAGWQLVSR